MSVSEIQSSILDSLVNQYVDSSTTEVTESDSELMMDDFLNIFLTQLQYQDPLNPMDSTDMTTQMAQITMVEQQYNTVEALNTISDQLGSQQGEYLGYLGKAVMIDGSAVTLKDGEVLGGNYILTDIADVEITIYDQDSVEVDTIYPGELEAGEYTVEWDGRDSDGNLLEDGVFYYEVTATDQDGEAVDVQTTYSGVVTGISLGDEPYLLTDEGSISIDSVIRVYDI